MANRINNSALDVAGASVSVLVPGDPDYPADAELYGVPDPGGRWIVGIGCDYPDVVLLGTREQLVAVAHDVLRKLG